MAQGKSKMLRSWFDKKFGRPRRVAVFSVPNDQGEGRKEGRTTLLKHVLL